ncbi:MAG TPA: 2-polyprenyl-3-methyl-6-methoxy-1,4-benzoquinone monooxygenase [Steroidobacteraceae bacterium]|nr:2-polyprenyl-3-methyl-6-methoxy-1,4-benzoquinone monooxygenase [Steroidobacteraceae bacterium]
MPAEPTLADQLLASADRALRAMFAPPRATRPTPGEPGTGLPEEQRRLAAGLMRVNHAGEVAAQGLYHGQALVARDPAVRKVLEQAAREETDHLAWCEQRLRELQDRPSRLHPFWYAGSFAIGVAAGLASDRVSLGFVAETERQVERHLDSHLQQLPAEDARSRTILEQMRADEQAHGEMARHSGGVPLPRVVQKAMQLASRVMTGTARHV